MPLKYNPTRDEAEPPKSFSLWAVFCMILLVVISYFIYKANQAPPPAPVVAAATPEPEPTPTPAPTPKPPRLAKEGTFFVLNYISVPTKSGVIGFEPGREVHFVQALQEKRKLLVSDGRYQMEVDPSQLTNDLDIAALARAQDAASQNQLAAFQAAEKDRYEKSRRDVDLAHSKDVAQTNARMTAGSGVGTSNSLNEAPKATNTVVHTHSNPYSYFSLYPQRVVSTP